MDIAPEILMAVGLIPTAVANGFSVAILIRLLERTLNGHNKPVKSVFFSPTGRYGLSGGDDGVFVNRRCSLETIGVEN